MKLRNKKPPFASTAKSGTKISLEAFETACAAVEEQALQAPVPGETHFYAALKRRSSRVVNAIDRHAIPPFTIKKQTQKT